MRAQKRRDTSAELTIRRRLHALGLRYRVDHRLEPSLRVRGDVVFTRHRVVVFVDGCFWHGCPRHSTQPKTNTVWWRDKIAANRARDRRNTVALEELGWTVIRVWEHVAVDEAVALVFAALRRDDQDQSD